MKNRTISAFREWKANTEYLIECLSEEMGCALVKNDNNMLRAHMINIQILDKTKDVVSDWMEKGERKMWWCSNCNRWTDERCLNCNLFQENENAVCIGQQCEKCKLYMEKEDLCGLVYMPKEVEDGNQ